MEFITLAESKAAGKGNICVTVTSISDLKAGSSSNGDWTRKDATVQDSSGKERIGLFNELTDILTLNHKYEITGIYWKESGGKSYLNFGKYTKTKDVGIPTEENQSTMDETTSQAPSSDEYLKQKQQEVKEQQDKKQAQVNKMFTEDVQKSIKHQIDIIIAIESIVTAKLTDCEINPNPAKIGMYMKFVFDKLEIKD